MSIIKSVVITGASTGIGRACALHMDALGWRVFAGVRNEADAESLRHEASQLLTPLSLDVTDASSINQAKTAVERSVETSGLSGLVNNAGIAYGGPVEFLDLDELRRTFEVNFFGAVAVTQAFLPLLRAGHGCIINMSSNSGLVASPFLSPYTTSKWALEALSDAMRVELDPWAIKVTVIEPGAIDTPIWNKGKGTAARLRARLSQQDMALYDKTMSSIEASLGPHGIPVGHVAKAVAHALTSKRPRTRYVVGLDAALTRLLARLPDGVRDAFFKKRLKRGY